MSALNEGTVQSWAAPDGVVELRCERKLGSVIAAARCLAAQRDGCTCAGRARVQPDASPQPVDREERLSEVVRLARAGKTLNQIGEVLVLVPRSVARYRHQAVALGLLPAPVVRAKVVIPEGASKPCEHCGTPFGPNRRFAERWLTQRFCRPSCRDGARRRAFLARVRAEAGITS